MSDIFDRAILAALGLEKRAKEVLDELQKAAFGVKEEGGLTPRETLENRLVEDGGKILKEFLTVVEGVKDRIEKEVSSSSGKVIDKLHIATVEEIEVIKEMARVAREKVDRLEKKVSELGERLKNRG